VRIGVTLALNAIILATSSVLTYTQTTQLRGAPKKEGRKKGKRGGAEKRKEGAKRGKGGAEKKEGAKKSKLGSS